MAVETYKELRDAYNSGKSFVLCTVIDVKGSSPAKSGQKMIVFRDGSFVGTIGGGINEARTIGKCMDMFAMGGTQIIDYDLSSSNAEDKEPICGGEFKVLLEFQSSAPRLCIFGAGHIGERLAKIADLTGYSVTIADARPDYANPEKFSKTINVICDSYAEAVKKARISEDTFVVVCTPGHENDAQAIEAVLPYKPNYLGLVGSGKKRQQFMANLKEKGFDPEQCEDIFMPIGMSFGSTTPEEIVIEIMAQIIAFRNGNVVRYSRQKKEQSEGYPTFLKLPRKK